MKDLSFDDLIPQQQKKGIKGLSFDDLIPQGPMEGIGTGQRVLEGIGKGMVDLGRGVGQRLGMVSEQEIAEARKVDQPLMDTTGGKVGNFLGTLAAAAPTMLIPGANTVSGAAAVGGALGAAQPTVEGESALKNAAMGAATGGASQYGLGKLAQFAGNRLAASQAKGTLEASQNAVRDATRAEAQAAGYVVPPSQSGAGIIPRVLEGVSGKYKTNQAAAIKNQNVTDRLARQALGLADDAPLTTETMQAVRNNAFQRGYEPVANMGAVETDVIFKKALDKIVDDYQGAARSFPGAVKNEVVEAVKGLRTNAMDTGDALKMTRILRDEASQAFAQGNSALGKANRKAATAIEEQVERALQSAGKDGAEMLKEFRAARQLMAKAHSVEQALVEGGGVVNARVLGAALQRGKPLSGELKTIGGFANNFRDVTRVPESGWANPITALDAFGAAAMGAGGAGLGSIALPAARMGARSAILSGPAQRMMGPSYGPGLLSKGGTLTLEELERMGAGGLLGAVYGSQQ